MFRRNISPQSLEKQNKPSRKPADAACFCSLRYQASSYLRPQVLLYFNSLSYCLAGSRAATKLLLLLLAVVKLAQLVVVEAAAIIVVAVVIIAAVQLKLLPTLLRIVFTIGSNINSDSSGIRSYGHLLISSP